MTWIRTSWLCLLLAVASPAAAAPEPSATTPREVVAGPFRWDFESPGPMHDLVAKVLRTAWAFLPVALLAALAVEAFGHGPGHPRDFGSVVWRAVVVVVLLTFYVPLFSRLMRHVFDPLAEAVTPASGVGEFIHRSVEAARGLPSGEGERVVREEGIGGVARAVVERSGFGGLFYDSLVALLLLLAQGLVVVIGKLGKLLAAVLFCLGPLALVGSIPRPSRTGTRWFTHFVTVLSWPVFNGVLLSALVAMGRDGAETTGYLAAMIAALLTAAMALATPRLASHIVGGTLENLIAAGYDSARHVQRDVAPSAALARSAFGGRQRGSGPPHSRPASGPTLGAAGQGSIAHSPAGSVPTVNAPGSSNGGRP